MKRTTLVPGVTSTRIGFGCAGLMREPSARKRRRLLDEVFDQGIRHFDVARMYGLGAAEAELGRFAQGRRHDIVIVTKFGIEAASAPGRLARLQSPARRLLSHYPQLRGYVKRRSNAFHQPHRYDADTARRSLETSLRELKTDYVDVLLLHDPSPTEPVNLPEICGYLEQARETGYLRAWGVAGEENPCVKIKRSLPASAIVQIRDDIFSRGARLLPELQPLITFGVLGAALDQVVAHLRRYPKRGPQWSKDIGVDCTSSDQLARLLLRDALRVNQNGVVLYSTTRPDRLRGLDAVTTAQCDDEDTALAEFRRHVVDELPPISRPAD